MTQAFVALGVIGGWHASSAPQRPEPALRPPAGGAPAVLIRSVVPDPRAGRRAPQHDDLRSLLRPHGIDDLGDVALATLEPGA
jgi:hypothetical protein